jgi:rSAM/selenodomain-associated transferase 1
MCVDKQVGKNHMNSTALIIMAKEPKIGSTKTRLCPPLKFKEAAKLYEVLLWDTIKMTTQIKGIDIAIAVTPPEATEYFKGITSSETHLIPVTCAAIGECLSFALGQLLSMGYSRVMALNSDGPTLPPAYIQQAVERLGQNDLVLGPAEDGGYYLIGVKKKHDSLLTGISWSTSEVLSQTLVKANQLGLTVSLIPPWYDVDTAKDIQRLCNELETLPLDTLINTRQFLDQWHLKY